LYYTSIVKLNIPFEKIIDQIQKQQQNPHHQQKPKVIIEGEKFEARLVTHLQTPKEAIESLVELISKAINDLKKVN